MSKTTDKFDFDDLTPVEIPVRYRGNLYILREASAGDAKKWRNAMLSGAKLTDGKVTSLGNIADSEAMLLSLCLFPSERDGNGRDVVSSKSVPLATLLTWPNRVTKPLFEELKRISDLGEDESSKQETEEELEGRIATLQARLYKLQTGASTEDDPTDY